jgi:hypothetical protein
MRSSSARSPAETAFAANVPQAAALRRDFDALNNCAGNNCGGSDTALPSLQAGAQLSLGHRRLGPFHQFFACR